MQTMCRLCETCDLGCAYQPKSLLHLTYSQGAACLPQSAKSQRAWIGATQTPSATACFGAGGARGCTTLQVTPQTPKQRVDRAILGDSQRCSPLIQTYGKSAGMVWGRLDHFCDIWFLFVTLGQVVHVTPQTPKRLVDQAVLGACQRCSPLTQTYVRSAGMVWPGGGGTTYVTSGFCRFK